MTQQKLLNPAGYDQLDVAAFFFLCHNRWAMMNCPHGSIEPERKQVWNLEKTHGGGAEDAGYRKGNEDPERHCECRREHNALGFPGKGRRYQQSRSPADPAVL